MSALMVHRHVWIFILFFSSLHLNLAEEEDLYSVLGVSRSATQSEIKKAYKTLAREWHPDKNNEEGAHERFLKINEAYETLGDKQRRAEYDHYGSTSSMHSHTGPDPFETFERFFSNHDFGGFSFNFGGGGHRSDFQQYKVSYRSFTLKILPESKTKPYLIYAYKMLCFECRRFDRTWDKVIHDLKTIGMGIGTVSREDDATLFGEVKIHHVPAVIAVIDGRATFLRGELGVHAIRDHIRGLFPRTLVTKVNDKSYKRFLNDWHDNRVRALFFSKQDQPSLRFLLMAFAFRHRIAAGFVCTSQSDVSEMRLVFNIQSNIENLLFFNEDTTMPVASLKMAKIARSTMDELADKNKYLILPRISSPSHFHELCPVQPRRGGKKLCVVLVSRNTVEDQQYRATFRQYAETYSSTSNRVRFAYIYNDVQEEFVGAVMKGRNPPSDHLQIVILFQYDENKIKYDVLDNGWSTDLTSTAPSDQLTSTLDKLTNQKTIDFPYKIKLPTIIDEHANGIFVRVWLKLADWSGVMVDYFWRFDALTAMTAILFMVMSCFIMYIGASIENEQVDGTKAAKVAAKKRYDNRQVDIHPFSELTYSNLVSKAPSGHYTILVLVEERTQEKMVQDFARVVFPYSRSVYLRFSFLLLDQYLPWYKQLLEDTLDRRRELDINKDNCVGTVLAINGHRNYYFLYHPIVSLDQLTKPEKSGGDFLGMDASDESDTEQNSQAESSRQSDIFNGLSNWMDRVYEGSLKRLTVRKWPDLSAMFHTDPEDKKNE